MKSVRLPNPVAPGLYAGESGELLVFYLAMEEYLAAHLAKLVAPGPDGRRDVFSDVKAGEGAFIPIMGM